MVKRISIIIFSTFCISILNADLLNFDKVFKNVRGIKKYNKNKFSEATNYFKDNALKHPDDATLHYNLGNTQFKNGDFEAAENSYNLSLRDPKFPYRSETLQNIGSIKFQEKNYPEAIKYFRDSLMEDPSNAAARHNYEVTSRLLQKQQNQQQQQNSDQQNKDQQDKNKQNKDKQEKDQKKSDEQKKNENQQKKEKKDKDQNEQKEKQEQLKKQEKKDKEDAEKILKALMQKEREELKKKKEKLELEIPKEGKYW